MKKQQSGFTLIELVVVIVILGVLAATAVPRFANLTADADQAVADAIAGAVVSAAVIEFGDTQSANGAGTIEAAVDSNETFTTTLSPCTGAQQNFTVTVTGGGTSASFSMPAGLCSGA